jgi:hypothetical protein
MSFFDDTKNAGLLLLIIALMDIVFALISIFALDGYKDLEMWKKILVIVGAVIGAAILALLGFGIMKGGVAFQIGPFFSDVKSKFGVLVAGTAGIGIADLIEGIFNIIAFGATSVGSLVSAVILIVMAWLMVSGGKVAGNVIWIILLIIYIIGIIVSAIASLVLVGIPSLLLFIMLLLFLLSPEVKSKMGMN